MRNETIAIHGGYEVEPTTKAVAVPIYQTVAYAFDSAEHGAALFNLEVEGYRYTRISNPTNEVLEKRSPRSKASGGPQRSLRAGRAALRGAQPRRERKEHRLGAAALRTTYTLFAHLLPGLGINVRFAESDHPAAIEKLIDGIRERCSARAWETRRQPSANRSAGEVAHRHGVPLIATTRSLRRFCCAVEYGADIVLHSLTKFMGGHGTTLGGIIVDRGKFP